MMFMVATPAGFVPYQIDSGEFPPGCSRSCKGSLHVRPSSTMTITADELAVLRTRQPGVAVRTKIKPASPCAEPPKPQVDEVVPKLASPKPRRTEKSNDR